MPALTQLRLVGASAGGALIGIAGSAALGMATGLVAYALSDGEEFPSVGLGTGVITLLLSTAIAVPLFSSLCVYRAGRKAGYRGRYGYALLGSGAGITLGIALGLALTARADPEDRRALYVVSGATAIGAAFVLAMLGYRASDKRRARLSPQVRVSAEGRHLSVGGRGRL